jgi:glycopeptide antibiotics resistance protein
VFGFIISLVIEILQLLFVEGRCMDVDDLILNTLGVVIGWSIFKAIKFLVKKNEKNITG